MKSHGDGSLGLLGIPSSRFLNNSGWALRAVSSARVIWRSALCGACAARGIAGECASATANAPSRRDTKIGRSSKGTCIVGCFYGVWVKEK